jgi:hypothetical protein
VSYVSFTFRNRLIIVVITSLVSQPKVFRHLRKCLFLYSTAIEKGYPLKPGFSLYSNAFIGAMVLTNAKFVVMVSSIQHYVF